MKLRDMKDQSFSRRTLTEWQEAAEIALKGKGNTVFTYEHL